MLEFTLPVNQIDYLIVGHVSADLTPTGPVAGGTVTYSGRTARALGCRTATLTSAAPDYDFTQALPDIEVRSILAANTTTFENIYTSDGRQQILHALAHPLTAAHLPPEWRRPAIAHLAPIANEVDPDMINLFGNSLVGLTPQGWFRTWDGSQGGRISLRDWSLAPAIFPLAAAVILSPEDLAEAALLDRYRQWARLLIVTESAAGCTVFFRDEVRRVPAPNVIEVNPTGAGDIFAAAFLVRLYQTGGNPWQAAEFANEIASYSVTQNDLEAKIWKQ